MDIERGREREGEREREELAFGIWHSEYVSGSVEAEITESRLTIKGEQLICTKPE